MRINKYLACTILLGLQSCTIGVNCYMFNNTDGTIRVFGCDEEIVIQRGEQNKIHVCKTLKVYSDGRIFKYGNFLPMPNKHSNFDDYFRYGFGAIKLYVQINTNGKIYAIKSDDSLPSINYIIQPEGFPVGPAKTRKNGEEKRGQI